MKDANKEFYTEGVDNEVVDLYLEAFDELVESVMLEAFKHQTAAEKLDAKKYRMSSKGKKAIAKYLKKKAKAGYKVDKLRSKLMKKVADFARRESIEEAEFENLFDVSSEALCESILEVLDEEEIALVDTIVEEALAFFEACKEDEDEDEDDVEIDPETGEETEDEEDLEEGFHHMTKAARIKAKKYRRSAAGRRARKNYLRNLKRRGGRVNRAMSLLRKKQAKFARFESEDMAFMEEFGLNEAELEALDSLIASVVAEGKNILDGELTEEEISFLEACKEEEDGEEDCVKIEVPFDDVEEIEDAAEECEVEVLEKDEENGIAYVCGDEEALRAFLDKLGYDDEIEDLKGEDDDIQLNEFKVNHQTAAEKLMARKYRMSAQGKKAIKKYLKKRAKAGYKVNKALSKKMTQVAKFRREAIEESLNAQFSATPLFESLNEGESNELKGIVFNAVTSILDQSYEKIAEDVSKEYEAYMNEEAMPEMVRIFEEYSHEIVKNLNEDVENYLDYVAESIVEELEGKNLIVKSQKTEALESFSEDLLALIKDKLNILPEQEDVLLKNKETIKSLSEDVQEAKVEAIRLKNKLAESEREIFVLKNTPAELSEMQKENLNNYVEDVLSEAEDFETFKNGFNAALREMNELKESKKEMSSFVVEKKEEKKSFTGLFESLERMGRI
jgi:hypothetical protein